jgi:potassium-dependent mechanosensitive channel
MRMAVKSSLGLVLLFVCLIAPAHVLAQESLFPSSLQKNLRTKIVEQSHVDPSTDDINEQRKTLESGLAQAKVALNERRNELRELASESTPEKENLTATVRSLELITARYQHALDGLKALERLAVQVKQTRSEIQNWVPPAGGPPWPLSLGDQTYIAMKEASRAAEQLDGHTQMLKRNQAALLKQRSDLDIEVRQMANQSPQSRLTHRNAVNSSKLLRLQTELSAVELELVFSDIRLQSNYLRQTSEALSAEVASKTWRHFDNRFAFDESAFNRINDQIEADLATNRLQRQSTHEHFDDALSQAAAATAALETISAAPNATAEAIEQAQRVVKLADARMVAARMSRDITFYEMEMLSVSQRLWQMRFDLYNGKDQSLDLQSLHTEYGDIGQQLKEWLAYDTQYIEEKSRTMREYRNAAVLAKSKSDLDYLNAMAESAQQEVLTLGEAVNNIESVQLLLTLTLREMAQFRDQANWKAQLGYVTNDIQNFAHWLWHFQLFTVSDNIIVDGRAITTERSITIGKSIGAIMILVLGFVLVRRMVTSVMKIAMRRSKLTQSTAMIVTRWITLFAGLTLIIFSFILVDIPLSIFAFAGGALAIGIGFGAQNLLQNLISGLMLLIEKPVRVGDWVEVGGLTGTVTSIGIRFSTLLSPTGTENLVPNSVLVQEKLVNWTYSSPEVRREIEVWVDYTADADHVTDLLMLAASQNPVVLKTPSPHVLLDSFTDRGMLFKLQFWVPMVPNVSGPVVMSEVRREIYASFKHHGIAFAYPHRTIDINSGAASDVTPALVTEPRTSA